MPDKEINISDDTIAGHKLIVDVKGDLYLSTPHGKPQGDAQVGEPAKIVSAIPFSIWDAKKFHWNLFLQGTFESIHSCPNWLYQAILAIKNSGQTSNGTVFIFLGSKFQYAVRFVANSVEVYRKPKNEQQKDSHRWRRSHKKRKPHFYR